MAYYERRLPHFSVAGVPLFITFRLHGSLPRGRSFRPDILTSNGEAFAAMDRLLDTARSGPSALRRPEIARMVAAAIRARSPVRTGTENSSAYGATSNGIP